MAMRIEAGSAQDTLARLRPDRPAEIHVAGPPRFTLRMLRENDRAEFVRVMQESREHLEQFSPLHLPDESDEALFERQLGLAERGETSGQALRRIAVAEEGRILGAFNLNSISRGLVWSADVNWWVAESAIGQGVATEALTRLVEFALMDVPDGLGLHELRACIQRENEASRALAVKVGFERCGEERSYIQTGAAWMVHDVWIRRVK